MPISGNELSEREQEILRLIATGASNKEIAQRLFISINTVKVHLRNIFGKIGVASRTEAAMYAVNARLASGSSRVQDIGGETSPEEQDVLSNGMLSKFKSSRMVLAVVLGLIIILGAIIIGLAAYFNNNQVSSTPIPENFPLNEYPRWTMLAPMPTARYGLATVTVDGLIFAIGGKTAKEVTGLVESYNPTTDLWRNVASKPTPVHEISAVVVGGKVFVPGGRLSSGAMTDVLEIYDPQGNTWVQGARLPKALSAYALAAFEGKLYLFGGRNGEQYLDTVFMYDPASDMWEAKIAMPSSIGYAGAAVVEGKIFILGGFDGKEPLKNSYVYQPNLDKLSQNPWGQAKLLPDARYGMGVAEIAGIVTVIGGFEKGNQQPQSLSYFPLDDTWRSFDNPKEFNPIYPGSTILGNYLHTLGGLLNGQPTAQHLAYQVIYTVSFPILQK